ncbi:hypothetical protein CEUSTIGMA_g5172.t1 [Chlamydomonas eustigma]|uniref:Uncharacterized protein n=1 Tax=Chlamydomonas eustigma TaxID=1157962 RepID=A0A250X486_9CHLO|nr:hypothetical protein CEUSTIGMA_g5172.t1 [Chlamydomonas eustigma]|eukprot:GAX77729.1 hypothetical protein CEUSTIGMA_g5172.t1 [Chlamydomonas eustigma]
MSTPTSQTQKGLNVPSTPMKPSHRDRYKSQVNVDDAIKRAKTSICGFSAEERQRVFHYVPRECIEPVFMTYCDWLSQLSEEPFKSLISLVQDLDYQIFELACKVHPNMSWEAWAEKVHIAAQDHSLRHELSRQLTLALIGNACRSLSFE